MPIPSLDQVPIAGATAAQEKTIRGALAFFEREAGPGRLELRRVVVEDVEVVGAAGGFQASRNEIQLDISLEGAVLENVLLHEVCHALDAAEGIVDGEPETFAALGEDRIEASDLYPSAEERREEAFAQLCGIGRLGLHLLATCDPDPLLQAAAVVVTDAVWPEPAPAAIEVGVTVQASWEQRFAAQDPWYSGSSAPGALNIQVVDVGTAEPVTLTLDVTTGDELAVAEESPAPAPPPLPLGYVGRAAGWSDGPAVADGFFPTMFAVPSWGLVAWNGSEWAPTTPSCGSGQPFVAGEEIWLGHPDITWGPTGLTR